jgi:hypothetical protein
MARKRKLRPGKGSKALIITRFIKPNQPLPDNNRDHRSNVVLAERVKDAEAKDIYKFRNELDAEEDGGDLLSANLRYVKVTMEGGIQMIYLMVPGREPLPEPFKEPKTKWRNSAHDDFSMTMSNNNKPVMSLEEIYSMHPEYGEYDESKFGDQCVLPHMDAHHYHHC